MWACWDFHGICPLHPVDNVIVLLQLLSDDVAKGSDESGNTGKHQQVAPSLPSSFNLTVTVTSCSKNKMTGVCGLPDFLFLSDWPRERAGALHGHAPTDTRTQPPGGRRSRHALPVGAGGGAFFHHWPAWRGPDHRPADHLPSTIWPLTFSMRAWPLWIIDCHCDQIRMLIGHYKTAKTIWSAVDQSVGYVFTTQIIDQY